VEDLGASAAELEAQSRRRVERSLTAARGEGARQRRWISEAATSGRRSPATDED